MLARGSGKVLELPSSGDNISICFANCCLLPHALTFQENSQCLLNVSMEVETEQHFELQRSPVWQTAHAARSTGICVFWGVYSTKL